MSNIAGKAYGMNVMTPMRPCRTWINRAALHGVARASRERSRGLLGLSHHPLRALGHHQARPMARSRPGQADRCKNDYMLFCSNFNGTWDQYIDAFSDGIPSGLDLFWYSSTKYPHSIPISAVQGLHPGQPDRHQLLLQFGPGRGAARHQVGIAGAARDLALAAKQASLSPADFRKQYVATLVGVQNDLGYQGYAPIASVDTDNADRNRERYVRSSARGRQSAAVNRCRSSDRGSRDADIRWRTLFPDGVVPIRTAPVKDGDRRDVAGSCVAQTPQPAADGRGDARLRRRTEPVRAQHAQPFRPLRDHRRRGLYRDAWGAIRSGDWSAASDLAVAQPQDHLKCPFLVLVVDFDAKSGADAERDSYLAELWSTMGQELREIFMFCEGFESKVKDAASFAAYIAACQLETTMSFNDYYAEDPNLPAWPEKPFLWAGIASLAVFGLGRCGLCSCACGCRGCPTLLCWRSWAWRRWLPSSWRPMRPSWQAGGKPFPSAPDSDLPSVLKALHLRRTFTRFAIDSQMQAAGTDAASAQKLYDDFAKFVATNRPDEIGAPTQAPGVIGI